MQKPIVVLGGNGMLGRDIVALLCSQYSSRFVCYAPNRSTVDITNEADLLAYLGKEKPFAVINAAAFTNVDGAETLEGSLLASAINHRGTGNLARVCNALGIILAHVSSDYVFAGVKGVYSEKSDYDWDPPNIYGSSKKLGELEVSTSCNRHYIIRTSWLMGAHGNNFVKTILKIAKTRSSIDVVNDQWGVPNFTEDVAAKIITILGSALPFGVYHPVSSGSCTWYDLAQKAIALRGYPCEVIPVSTNRFPRPAPRPHRSILENTKLPPGKFWDEGLKDFLWKYPDLENG